MSEKTKFKCQKYSDDLIDDVREGIAKKYGVEYSDYDAEEALDNLTGFFRVLMEIKREKDAAEAE